MLDGLANWCTSNAMLVNPTKSNIFQLRPQSTSRFSFDFTCGEHSLKTVGHSPYLGLLLGEFPDDNNTVKYKAQSACRALRLLTAKSKSLGSMPYDVFVNLYDSMVWPIVLYGASIWGYKSISCINAKENRAMRLG